MLCYCLYAGSEKKEHTNELIYKIDPQTQKINLWLPKGKEGWVGVNYEFGIVRYELLYIKQTGSSGTGKYIQYPVINQDEKGICTCMYN